MSIHYNGQNIKEMYYNGQKISEAYYNNEKVFSSGIAPGTVVFESSTVGTYSVEIPVNGRYEVTLVGGGGYGFQQINSSFFSYASGGGSGACFQGILQLSKGTYTITVGGTTTAFNISAGLGGDGSIDSGGSGGVLNTSQASSIISSTIVSNGNSGGRDLRSTTTVFAYGGASLYGGYGKGADSNANNKTNGYIKIIGAN